MRALVVKEFYDCRIYLPGNTYEGGPERIAELEAMGLVKPEKEEKKARKAEKE